MDIHADGSVKLVGAALLDHVGVVVAELLKRGQRAELLECGTYLYPAVEMLDVFILLLKLRE